VRPRSIFKDSPESQNRSSTIQTNEHIKAGTLLGKKIARQMNEVCTREAFKNSAKPQAQRFAVQHSGLARIKAP
jgi:hypothetical protein